MGSPLLTLGIIAGLVVVHETGHVLAGVAIGIPRSALEIRFGFPVSEVVLRDAQGRVCHGDRARYRRLVRTPKHDFAFTAGGIVGQTVAVVAAASVLAPFDATRRLAERIGWASLLLLLGYVVLDAVATGRRGRPHGDTSSLWLLSRSGTVATLAAVAALHVVALTLLG